MGRVYTARLSPTAYTTAVDFFEVLADVDSPVKVHGWHLFQTTELGDSAEEILQLETVRGVGATTGSGGAAAEFPVDVNDSAAVTVVEVGNTTRMTAGGGSVTTLEELGWNLRIQYDFFYPPELRPRVDPGELWTLSLVAAPGDSTTIGGTLWFEEL